MVLKKLVTILLCLGVFSYWSFASSYTMVGAIYQNNVFYSGSDNYHYRRYTDNYDSLGVGIVGFVGNKIGFIYDFSVLLPVKSFDYSYDNYSIAPTDVEDIPLANTFILAETLVGVSFQPINKDFLFNYGFGMAVKAIISLDDDGENNAVSLGDIILEKRYQGLYTGIGTQIGFGIALSPKVMIAANIKGVYYLGQGAWIEERLANGNSSITAMIGICLRN